MDFVDIHNHLLPGVDDGPRDLEGSVELLRAAWETGVRRIAATPHRFLPPWPNADSSALRRSFNQLVVALGERARDPGSTFLSEMRIHLGAEHHLSRGLLSALDSGDLLTLNGGRYVLVELPPFMAIETIIAAARRLAERGLRPLIAHVERCGFFREESGTRALELLVGAGCTLQVNAESLLGNRRRDPLRARCVDLLRRRIVRVVASDAHSATSRRPLLDAAFEVLRQELPEDRALASVRDDPAAILDGRPLL